MYWMQAEEGINGTVAGTPTATDLYIDAMLSHPVLGQAMTKKDFKMSDSYMYGDAMGAVKSLPILAFVRHDQLAFRLFSLRPAIVNS